MTRTILLAVCLAALAVPFVAAQEKRSNDLFIVTVNGKRGYIDRTGKIVIEPQFAGASDFSEGRAVVAVDSPHYQEGYINQQGKLVIPATFDSASAFEDGVALVGVGELGLHGSGSHKFGFIDRQGQWVIKPTYRTLYGFSEGLAAAMNDAGKWGFIERSGKVVIPFQFEVGSAFSDGLAPMYSKGKYGYIDKSGKFLIPPQYSSACSFSEGLACVKIGGVVDNPYPRGMTIGVANENAIHGYVDKTGKLVVKISNVDDLYPFFDGLARIMRRGNDGFIDKKGRVVIDANYGGQSEFHDGLKLSIINGKFGWIDKTGKIALRTGKPIISEMAWLKFARILKVTRNADTLTRLAR